MMCQSTMDRCRMAGHAAAAATRWINLRTARCEVYDLDTIGASAHFPGRQAGTPAKRAAARSDERACQAAIVAAVLIVAMAGQARAATSDTLADCSAVSIGGAKLEHILASDAAAVCEIARTRLHFPLTGTVLQHLVDGAVVSYLKAREQKFDLSVVTAADYIVGIVELRDQASNAEASSQTIELVTKVDYNTDGVVSPGVLLMQLHASGPLVKTLSDDGVTHLAAYASIEEKAKVAAASFRTQQPVSVAIAGPWRVAGHVTDSGQVISCSLSRDLKDGAGEFGYTVVIAATNGDLRTQAIFSADTALANGWRPSVNLTFDRTKPIRLAASVSNGRLLMPLPEAPAALADLLNRFQHSGTLRIDTAGKPKAVVGVDLTNAAAGFDQAGLCMKNAMTRGVAIMKGGN